jgi:hypothetical protein
LTSLPDLRAAMPIAALVDILLAVTCVVHVARTGRPYFWIYIVLLVPVIGSLAYVAAELLPSLLRGPSGQKAAARTRSLLDPDRPYREAQRALRISPTPHNMCALAAVCIERRSYDEATALYRGALTGMHAEAPDIMDKLARALFLKGDMAGTVAALDALRAANPGYRSDEAHVIYAQALEALGRNDEALAEYDALAGYWSGEEARLRYALLLQRLGRAGEARQLLERIAGVPELAPQHYVRGAAGVDRRGPGGARRLSRQGLSRQQGLSRRLGRAQALGACLPRMRCRVRRCMRSRRAVSETLRSHCSKTRWMCSQRTRSAVIGCSGGGGNAPSSWRSAASTASASAGFER